MAGTWIRSTLTAGLLGLVCVGFTGKAFGASEEEARKDFVKEYASQFPDDRKKAIEKLAGAKEIVSARYLYQAGLGDSDEGVRLAATTTMCTVPDPDGSISQFAAQIFEGEKSREGRVPLAKAMENLEFKYEPLRVMVDFLLKCRYPSMPNDNDWNNNNKGPNTPGGGNASGSNGPGASGGGMAGGIGQPSKELVQKARDLYLGILGSINKLSGEKFAANQRTSEQVKKWWDTMSPKLMKADYDLRQQKKAAAGGKDVAAKTDKPAEKEAVKAPEGKKNPLKDVLDKAE